MLSENRELNDFLLNAQGISRRALNVMCFIGAFVFGWLLAVVFEMLGRKNQGWFYVVPLIVLLVISRQNESPLILLAPLLYIAGWIHANVILSGLQKKAKERIAQLDLIPAEQQGPDALLEKGLLQAKILKDAQLSYDTFIAALRTPGGEPQLINMAGVALFQNKKFAEAKEFFNRALPLATTEALIKVIKQNQQLVDKKLR